jgi:hypothetical protein
MQGKSSTAKTVKAEVILEPCPALCHRYKSSVQKKHEEIGYRLKQANDCHLI